MKVSSLQSVYLSSAVISIGKVVQSKPLLAITALALTLLAAYIHYRKRENPIPLKEDRRVTIHEMSLGTLSIFPSEILLNIFSFLSEKDVKSIPNGPRRADKTNAHWLALCNQGVALQQHIQMFGESIVNAVGSQLLRARWIDLKTVASQCNACKDIPSSYQATINAGILKFKSAISQTYQIEEVEEIRRNILKTQENPKHKLRNNEEQIDGYSKIQLMHNWGSMKHLAYAFPSGAAMPKVYVPNEHLSSFFVYWINNKDLQKDAIVKFVDAFGRYGIAFQYLYKFTQGNRVYYTKGVATLHQLVHEKRDYFWLENQNPYQRISAGTFTHHLCNGQVLRSFYFVYPVPQGLTSQSEFNLKWLKKFCSGQECGSIVYGLETTGEGFPKMQMQSNPNSWSLIGSRLKLEFFESLNWRKYFSPVRT